MTTYQIAIETIGKTGSLAILKDETVVSALRLPSDRRTAAVLAVSLDKLLTQCRQAEIPLSWVSVAAGPGSFTGIRIGVTAAKMLGYALKLSVLPVGSLAALAIGVERPPGTAAPGIAAVAVGINAYRGQAYGAKFTARELSGADADQWEGRAEVFERQAWNEALRQAAATGPIVLTGDSQLVSTEVADRARDRAEPDAVGVGRVAFLIHQARGDGCLQRPFDVLPRYLKPSAAEEKANQIAEPKA